MWLIYRQPQKKKLPSHGRGHWFNPSRAHHLLPLYNNDLRHLRRHREVRRHSQCDRIVTESSLSGNVSATQRPTSQEIPS